MKGTKVPFLAGLGVAFMFLWGVPPACAQDHALPPAALQRVRTYFESQLKSRYMEQDCHDATYPGWDDFKQWLRRCRYTVEDKDGSTKTAEVIMLNPTPDQAGPVGGLRVRGSER